jgi:flagellar hook-associated protein 3 FlgL
MRVSNAMIAENIKNHLFRHSRHLLQTQERIASGKRINRPSDDPVGMARVMGYRTHIEKLHQFNANITAATFHLDVVDDVLNSVTDLLVQAKKIASDPHRDLRGMMAEEVAILRDQVLQFSNWRNSGIYIFAGDRVDTPPFSFDPDTGNYGYMGDSGTRDFNIGESLNMHITADGSAVFGSIFETLANLEADLRDENTAGILSRISELEACINGLNETRAVNAGKSKRLQATATHNDRLRVNFEDLLSRTEDTDLAAAAIDLTIQRTAYEATLATAAKIVQPTLIDFLK